MKSKRFAGVAGALAAVGIVAACGSSSAGKGTGTAASVASGSYACHDLEFAGQHPKISFPQLTLQDGKYTVGGHLGGTYTAAPKDGQTTLAFSGGLLGGASARYDAAAQKVTFGGPTQMDDVISDAPGLICSMA